MFKNPNPFTHNIHVKQKNPQGRKSPRAAWWDYQNNAAYFVTICTKGKEHFFGKVEKGKMLLSPQGAIADVFWHQIQQRVPGVGLGAWIVMPNHVHGIVIIRGDVAAAGPLHATALQYVPAKNQHMAAISPPARSLSSIIRSYKSAVTMHCNRLELPFGWQGRYHDHIIRDEISHDKISSYIQGNPGNWNDDLHVG
ncbi:MAG: transposase [Bacteroidia bacterium]